MASLLCTTVVVLHLPRHLYSKSKVIIMDPRELSRIPDISQTNLWKPKLQELRLSFKIVLSGSPNI